MQSSKTKSILIFTLGGLFGFSSFIIPIVTDWLPYNVRTMVSLPYFLSAIISWKIYNLFCFLEDLKCWSSFFSALDNVLWLPALIGAFIGYGLVFLGIYKLYIFLASKRRKAKQNRISTNN